jgi:CheY-specific phosphatase CheX
MIPSLSADSMQIVGSVSFAGKAMGSINLHFSEAFARLVTAAMLDMDEDDIEGDEEVHDVVGELSNMVGGDLKSRLCDAGLTCELSIPTITSGREFGSNPKVGQGMNVSLLTAGPRPVWWMSI